MVLNQTKNERGLFDSALEGMVKLKVFKSIQMKAKVCLSEK